MVIEDIRNAFLSGVPIEYKAHCLKRMLERNISRNDIKNCVVFGEIIEDYPLDDNNPFEASFPACLISWVDNQNHDAIHVVLGYNGKKVIIISVYHPDTEHWEKDFKTRKRR